MKRSTVESPPRNSEDSCPSEQVCPSTESRGEEMEIDDPNEESSVSSVDDAEPVQDMPVEFFPEDHEEILSPNHKRRMINLNLHRRWGTSVRLLCTQKRDVPASVFEGLDPRSPEQTELRQKLGLGPERDIMYPIYAYSAFRNLGFSPEISHWFADQWWRPRPDITAEIDIAESYYSVILRSFFHGTQHSSLHAATVAAFLIHWFGWEVQASYVREFKELRGRPQNITTLLKEQDIDFDDTNENYQNAVMDAVLRWLNMYAIGSFHMKDEQGVQNEDIDDAVELFKHVPAVATPFIRTPIAARAVNLHFYTHSVARQFRMAFETDTLLDLMHLDWQGVSETVAVPVLYYARVYNPTMARTLLQASTEASRKRRFEKMDDLQFDNPFTYAAYVYKTFLDLRLQALVRQDLYGCLQNLHTPWLFDVRSKRSVPELFSKETFTKLQTTAELQLVQSASSMRELRQSWMQYALMEHPEHQWFLSAANGEEAALQNLNAEIMKTRLEAEEKGSLPATIQWFDVYRPVLDLTLGNLASLLTASENNLIFATSGMYLANAAYAYVLDCYERLIPQLSNGTSIELNHRITQMILRNVMFLVTHLRAVVNDPEWLSDQVRELMAEIFRFDGVFPTWYAAPTAESTTAARPYDTVLSWVRSVKHTLKTDYRQEVGSIFGTKSTPEFAFGYLPTAVDTATSFERERTVGLKLFSSENLIENILILMGVPSNGVFEPDNSYPFAGLFALRPDVLCLSTVVRNDTPKTVIDLDVQSLSILFYGSPFNMDERRARVMFAQWYAFCQSECGILYDSNENLFYLCIWDYFREFIRKTPVFEDRRYFVNRLSALYGQPRMRAPPLSIRPVIVRDREWRKYGFSTKDLSKVPETDTILNMLLINILHSGDRNERHIGDYIECRMHHLLVEPFYNLSREEMSMLYRSGMNLEKSAETSGQIFASEILADSKFCRVSLLRNLGTPPEPKVTLPAEPAPEAEPVPVTFYQRKAPEIQPTPQPKPPAVAIGLTITYNNIRLNVFRTDTPAGPSFHAVPGPECKQLDKGVYYDSQNLPRLVIPTIQTADLARLRTSLLALEQKAQGGEDTTEQMHDLIAKNFRFKPRRVMESASHSGMLTFTVLYPFLVYGNTPPAQPITMNFPRSNKRQRSGMMEMPTFERDCAPLIYDPLLSDFDYGIFAIRERAEEFMEDPRGFIAKHVMSVVKTDAIWFKEFLTADDHDWIVAQHSFQTFNNLPMLICRPVFRVSMLYHESFVESDPTLEKYFEAVIAMEKLPFDAKALARPGFRAGLLDLKTFADAILFDMPEAARENYVNAVYTPTYTIAIRGTNPPQWACCQDFDDGFSQKCAPSRVTDKQVLENLTANGMPKFFKHKLKIGSTNIHNIISMIVGHRQGTGATPMVSEQTVQNATGWEEDIDIERLMSTRVPFIVRNGVIEIDLPPELQKPQPEKVEEEDLAEYDENDEVRNYDEPESPDARGIYRVGADGVLIPLDPASVETSYIQNTVFAVDPRDDIVKPLDPESQATYQALAGKVFTLDEDGLLSDPVLPSLRTGITYMIGNGGILLPVDYEGNPFFQGREEEEDSDDEMKESGAPLSGQTFVVEEGGLLHPAATFDVSDLVGRTFWLDDNQILTEAPPHRPAQSFVMKDDGTLQPEGDAAVEHLVGRTFEVDDQGFLCEKVAEASPASEEGTVFILSDDGVLRPADELSEPDELEPSDVIPPKLCDDVFVLDNEEVGLCDQPWETL